MGCAHLQALSALDLDALAGWAPSSRHEASVRATGAECLHGTLDDALRGFRPSHVVIASPVETLACTALTVMAAGVRNLLVEKPAALSVAEGNRLASTAAVCGARMWVGYNRRFYASVRIALDRIRRNGEQVTSVFFEFNETIVDPAGPTGHARRVCERWVLANSLHVLDMALLPAGWPVINRSCFVTAGARPWHRSAAVFTGAGETDRGVPFAYHANWTGPGRWAVEWVTPSERYVFRPLERLGLQRPGAAAAVDAIDLDDDLDRRFKPGVYLQDKAFVEGPDHSALATLDDALKLLALGEVIGAYTEPQLA
jgi:predicted dehydrogenase